MENSKTPIVFCFDDHLLMPAGVCLTSLLENAKKETFYDIFILHEEESQFPNTGYLERLKDKYSNCEITYRSVGEAFKGAFQIRGITQATYYRLLIPELIPEYDKIMYHDVDVIFREDLSAIFLDTDMSGCYMAGVVAPSFLDVEFNSYIKKIGLDAMNYILAGDILLNTGLMREDKVVERFKEIVKQSAYKYQDMDILNIVCQGKAKRLPPMFCGTVEIFRVIAYGMDQALYSKAELSLLNEKGIVHYNGPKPWSDWCPNFDIWWEYYRKSPFYDAGYYFTFYLDKVKAFDAMPLRDRVMLLLRYFRKRGK